MKYKKQIAKIGNFKSGYLCGQDQMQRKQTKTIRRAMKVKWSKPNGIRTTMKVVERLIHKNQYANRVLLSNYLNQQIDSFPLSFHFSKSFLLNPIAIFQTKNTIQK